MNSRERVLLALNHREPDKVPIDLGGTNVTSITAVAYENLRASLGMDPDPHPRISNFGMQSVYPREDLCRRYEIDFRAVRLRPPSGFALQMLDDESFYDEYHIRWRKAAYYYDAVERPLADCTSVHELDQAQWLDPYDPGRVEGLRQEAQALHDDTDYAIVADIVCAGPFEGAAVLRGHEQFCVDLHWDPNFAEALLDKVTETALAMWEVYLREVGEYVHVVAQGDDVGIQTGPFLSPEMYRRFIKPRQRRIFDYIRSQTAAKMFYHSCGSVFDLIPDFVDIGVDILNPIQRSAAKMDIVDLKREFGDAICFWGGGIDVQTVLPFATPEEIEQEVRHAIEVLAPGGGYVFVPSHNIQADVTPERIDRTYQAAVRYRGY